MVLAYGILFIVVMIGYMIKAKIVRRSPSTWGLVGIFVVLVSTYLFMIILDTDLSDGRFSGRGILVLAGSLLAAFLVQFRFLRAERTFYLGDLLLPLSLIHI